MIDFYYDCSSPWTYLGFHAIQPLAAEFQESIIWKPIIVGGIFNTINPSVYASRAAPVPQKARYALKDMQDWANLYGLTIRMPPSVFPVNSVKVMRGCIWLAPQGKLVAFSTAVFEAYWGRDEDISQDHVLTAICESQNIDPKAFFAGIGEQKIKDQLRINTDEAIARGAFGSPTIYINGDDMYFGNDRMQLIRAALQRIKAKA